MRIDKWLWAARFFKTRSLAAQAVESTRVLYRGERCKPSRELHIGDQISIKVGESFWEIVIQGLSDRRGSATVARQLYQETPQSQARRQEQEALSKLQREPAREIKGRPTKRDRRRLGDLHN